ncbi:MAG TPA: hypothetical protein VFJ80_14235 [Candidatus Limnocylindrales bacterium]|jgi:hypothetical protein|nr:hypothetical protein [Candidatus Limnocylindrales bacterium]
MIGELMVFLAAVGVFAIGGIVVGMLVAPRLARLADPKDEDAGDGTD